MAGKRILAICIAALMMLGMLSAAAFAAPWKNQNPEGLDDSCETWDWQNGGWICLDEELTNENPGGNDTSTKGNKTKNWVDETETETTYKGNSGKIRDETTLHCVYNPSGNLMTNKSDPGCPATYGG
jgi:hypothetical protein